MSNNTLSSSPSTTGSAKQVELLGSRRATRDSDEDRDAGHSPSAMAKKRSVGDILAPQVSQLPLLALGYPGTDEIVISLSTDAKLIPVYISPCPEAKTLAFDFNHNGYTQVTQNKAPGSGVRYTVDVNENSEILSAIVTSVSTGAKTTYRVPAGQVHHLHDTILKGVFGKEGISSGRLLYTLRTQPPGDEKAMSEVWICEYDGKNHKQLTHEKEYCITPSFLPPATGHLAGTFFYVSYKTGQSKIYASSLRGGPSKRYISLRGNQLTPAISSQRDQIAFVSDAGGNPDLFIQSFSPESGPIGKPKQLYSAPRAAQASPTFSPDGKQIAFVSNKDGSPRIYLLPTPPVGEKPRLLTRENRENTSPSWSSDGKKLAYSAMTGGTRQIWIYDFATGQEKQLTHGSGHKENPCWAPNSLHLVFNSANQDGSDLYLVNLNQPEVVKITGGPGEKRFPSWSR